MKTQKIQVINSDNSPLKVGDTVEIKKVSTSKPTGGGKGGKIKQPTLRDLILKLDQKLDRVIELNNLKA